MIAAAIFGERADAEKAGARLIDAGIPIRLDGDLAWGANVVILVAEEDAQRAAAILELPPAEIEKFHPCPTCGAGDPDWYGKRKVILFVVVAAGLISLAFAHAPCGSVLLACIAMVLIMFLAGRIPDFECRNCHARFS